MDWGGPGLTVTKFLNGISDRDARGFLNPDVRSILDALFGGKIQGEELRCVVRNMVDFKILLSKMQERNTVLRLLPDQKRVELAQKIGRLPAELDDHWTAADVKEICDFFGLAEDPIAPEPRVSCRAVSPSYGLFDHQRAAVRELIPLLDQNDRRAILHLPTGVGKTRTAMHVVARWLRSQEPSVVVWLASTHELLEQAQDAFGEAWTHLGTRPVACGSAWGQRMPDLADFRDGFLVMGLAKALAMLDRDGSFRLGRLAQRVRLVVFDEAHQSIAPTYRRITDELAVGYGCAVLGLTATPGRTWNDIDRDGELAHYYGGNKVTLTVPGGDPIRYLIDHGYLARPHFRTLFAKPGAQTDIPDLERVGSMLDVPPSVVASLSLSEQYVVAVIGAVGDLLNSDHLRVLVFAGTVTHAHLLTAVLIARGTRAEVVTAQTAKQARDRAIRDFRRSDGTPMVLVNYGVLTTGFDAPCITAVVIARHTLSLVLYSQMVGRGLRGPNAQGTKSCEIVTVVNPALPGFGDLAEAFLNWEDVWTIN